MPITEMPTQSDSPEDGVVSTPHNASTKRQFKHYIFTAEHDIFNPDKRRQKRPRSKVACFACKTRKVKCSGRRPMCESCERNNSECSYRDTRPVEPSKSKHRAENDITNCDDVDADPEIVSTLYCPSISPARRVTSPDFFGSLTEPFDSFNSWPSIEMNMSGPSDISPLMLSVRSPRAQLPGELINDSHITTKIRVPYFRWFGPTGIVPGFTKVLVDLRPASSPDSRGSDTSPSATSFSDAQTTSQPAPHEPTYTFSSPSESPHSSPLFDEEDDLVPKPEILDHLLHIFFDYFGCHFPFYEKDRFMNMARSKSIPALLLNAMCALASRFSYHPDIRKEPIYLCGERFGDKAKQLIFVLLAVPSYDLVASLLMLSWYEFGCNRDVGFWMYTGMAIRMAQDLGMHKEERMKSGRAIREGNSSGDNNQADMNVEFIREEEEETSLRLNLFWSIYFIDRIISLGTGRPLTLRDEQISCPLPADGTFSFDNSVWPNPFPHLLRIMTVQGKVNEEISTIRQPEDLTAAKKTTLFALQNEIIYIYTSLDMRLSFNVGNFQDYVSLGLGGSFLLLHVWFHAVIITLHRPGLMFGIGTLAHTLAKESLEVSMTSANTITSILGLAELIDDKTITGSPFLNQAIYIAGLAFIAESEMHKLNAISETDCAASFEPAPSGNAPPASCTSMTGQLGMDSVITSTPSSSIAESSLPGPTASADLTSHTKMNTLAVPSTSSHHTTSTQSTKNATQDLLRFASKRNYETCLKAISTLKRYWRGIGWILSTMEQKAMGLSRLDPSEESVDPESKIDLRDAGMLRRLVAVKNHRRQMRENERDLGAVERDVGGAGILG